MGIGSLAAASVSWLVRGIKAISRNSELYEGVAMAVVGNNAKIAKRVSKFFDKLRAAEETLGAHTNAWGLVEDAAGRGEGVHLPAAEVKYLHGFKRAFDKTIKPIGTKLAGKFEPAAGLPEVEEIPDLEPDTD